MSRLVCGGIPEHILGDRPPYHTTCPPSFYRSRITNRHSHKKCKGIPPLNILRERRRRECPPLFLPPLFLSLFFLPPPVTSSKGKRPLGPFSPPPLPRSFSSCFAIEGKKRETVASPPLKLFFLGVGGAVFGLVNFSPFFPRPTPSPSGGVGRFL